MPAAKRYELPVHCRHGLMALYAQGQTRGGRTLGTKYRRYSSSGSGIDTIRDTGFSLQCILVLFLCDERRVLDVLWCMLDSYSMLYVFYAVFFCARSILVKFCEGVTCT